MTTTTTGLNFNNICPMDGDVTKCHTEEVLKLLTGKWALQILFRLHFSGTTRFSEFLRKIKGANKQTLSVALRDLTENGYILKTTIQLKPLHIEYSLSEKGIKLIPLLKQFEVFNDN